MDSHETAQQIQQMMNFILNEAKDKANEIDTKGLEEYSIEKFRIVNSQKEKIRSDYAKKVKAIETQCAISRSLAINASRLEKIKARQEQLAKIATDVKGSLLQELRDEGKSKTFTTNLIVQGLLMLLEDEVEVRCREADQALFKSCLPAAEQRYSQVVKAESGANKSVKLTIGKIALPPAPTAKSNVSCLGGVVLACQSGNITVDNTIDSRLDLVMEQDKPTIRRLMFGAQVAMAKR